MIERQKREEEVELAVADEVAPWLIDPKSSYFFKLLSVINVFAQQIELILVPLVWLDASILHSQYITI